MMHILDLVREINMICLILGIILIIIGVRLLYKSSLLKDFYNNVRNGKISEYKRTTGIVICDAYDVEDATEAVKKVTPIVEYKVNGETYETQNPVLKTGAELPVGTKMCVWYRKDDPRNAVLSTELDHYFDVRFFGFIIMAFGIMIFLLGI